MGRLVNLSQQGTVTAIQMSFFDGDERVLEELNRDHRMKLAEEKKPRVVAESVTQVGGPCNDCHAHIPRFDRIFKVATTGNRSGGKWVCGNCAARYKHD
jgi:hypothetical protein